MQRLVQLLQTVVQPPAAGPPGRPVTGIMVIQNKQRQHLTTGSGGKQGRIIRQAQILTKPVHSNHVVSLHNEAAQKGIFSPSQANR